MEYLHPSISSKIIDDSITFATAQGVTQLFCAFTSDKGPDNVITPITSPSEFLFHYGEPNIKKHGQAAYNVMNWLLSNGGVFALRVAPDNAGYSHAFVNIQTKEGTRKELNNSGEEVDFPAITLRTTAAYTSINNTSEGSLEMELNKLDREKSVDGFDNNFLFAVYPKGRGKAYDNLGFRISLNDSFDETYAFRVYSFEVVKMAESGSTQILEGPFFVSLDPDAVSTSNESMFIKDVIETHSLYFNILFNEDAYDKLGETINSEVHPNTLDFFNGVSRVINDEAETYLDATLEKEIDVHYAISQIIDASDPIERSIVSIDNSYRSGIYSDALSTLDNTKDALSKVRADTYPLLMDDMVEIADEELTNGDLKTSKDYLKTRYDEFIAEEKRYNVTTSEMDIVGTRVIGASKAVLSDVKKILDYTTAIEDTAESLQLLVDKNILNNSFEFLSTLKISSASKQSSLAGEQQAITEAKMSTSTSEKLDAVLNALTTSEDAIRFGLDIEVDVTLPGEAVSTDRLGPHTPEVPEVLVTAPEAGRLEIAHAEGTTTDEDPDVEFGPSPEQVYVNVLIEKPDDATITKVRIDDELVLLDSTENDTTEDGRIKKFLIGQKDTSDNTILFSRKASWDVIVKWYNDSDELVSVEHVKVVREGTGPSVIEKEYMTAYSKYEKAVNELVDVEGKTDDAIDSVELLLEKVRTFIDETIVNVQGELCKSSYTTIKEMVATLLPFVTYILSVVDEKSISELEDTLTSSIQDAQSVAQALVSLTYDLSLENFNNYIFFRSGSDGDLDERYPALKASTTTNLLIQAYTGLIDPQLNNKKDYPIDLVLDANYPVEVKNAIVSLSTQIRVDFLSILDTGFQESPQQALDFRQNSIPVSSYMVAIFTQDFVVYDQYTGRDIKVTSPYFLSSKIPEIDIQHGIHWAFVGPRRGTISGFKKLSWNPTEPWKERLYKKKVNYVEQDSRRTKFGSQLTSQTVISALSDINNVRTLLRIKRDVETLAEDYQFEFNDSFTLASFQGNLNSYLEKWISNRACSSINGSVYASDYDKQQKIARVKIDLVFNNLIERILIDLVVGK